MFCFGSFPALLGQQLAAVAAHKPGELSKTYPKNLYELQDGQLCRSDYTEPITVTKTDASLLTYFISNEAFGDSDWFGDQKAVPKTKIRINLPGRSALFREEVHFFPENFGFLNSLLYNKTYYKTTLVLSCSW